MHTTMTTNVFTSVYFFETHQVHVMGDLVTIIYETPAGARSVLLYPGKPIGTPEVLAMKASKWFGRWMLSSSDTFLEGPEDLLDEDDRVAS